VVDWNKCLGCEIFLSLDHVYGVGSDLDIQRICYKCLDDEGNLRCSKGVYIVKCR